MAASGPKTGASPLTLLLFGPMEVRLHGRPVPPLRSRKALWTLALLALRQDRQVAREWLAGTLWPDGDTPRAFSNLRVVLSELRQLLGDQSARLQSPNRHHLCLDLTGADVDVSAFDAALISRKPEALRRAAALYRGPLLEGCHEEWVFQERLIREQNCLKALQLLGSAALAEGDPVSAGDFYRRAISLDPWHEAARRGLMEVFAQGGDRNAALQVYREFVDVLRSDPTAVPDEETSALYTKLRAEARRSSRRPVPVVPEVVVPAISGYLPHPPTDLVGREDECLEVAACLKRSRLVTLTGPGGIGKTRLAMEVAREIAQEYPEGVWLVSLEALSEGRLLAPQVASVLGLREAQGCSWQESVTEYLDKKRLLLVLDNCEHLLEASAQFVGHLLHACGKVRILATSREALGIHGEVIWTVPALAVSDPGHLPSGDATLLRVLSGYESVRLFVERAQAVQKSFSLTASNARTVAQISVQLEGIPLAIELAAARIRAMTVEQMASRLHDHLGLLTGGSRAALPRQQTLRATLDWSYDLLSVSERLLLHRLSVFAGGWTLEAAEQVCVGEGIAAGQVLDLLTSLVDKSLVAFEEREEAEEGRYRLLEIVRQYAAERLQASGAAAQVYSRHGNYYLSVAEESAPHLEDAEQKVWFRRLEREHDNLRAALTRESEEAQGAERRLRLAGALWRFWFMRGHYREGRQALARVLERANPDIREGARARALRGAGALAYAENDYDLAQGFYEESLRIFQELEDKPETARLLTAMSIMATERGDYPAARALVEESLLLLRTLENRSGLANALGNLGLILHQQNDYDAAQTYYEQSLGLFEEVGDRRSVGWMLSYLGSNASAQRDYASAQTYYEESLGLFEEIQDRKGMAVILNELGRVAARQGDFLLAQGRQEESVSLHRELGDRRALAWTLANLGGTYKEREEYVSACAAAEESLRLFHETRDRRGEAAALIVLGEVAAGAGDNARARTHFFESLRTSRDSKDRVLVAMNLERLAAVLPDPQQSSVCVRLWGAAAALRKNLGTPPLVSEQAQIDQWVEQARHAMGDNAFEAAWREGQALPWEQTVSDALVE